MFLIWHSCIGNLVKRIMGPVSLKQAIEIAASISAVGAAETNLVTECVTVCPHRQTLKQQFINDYETHGTLDLTEYIDEDEFDVIVLKRDLSSGSRTNYSQSGTEASENYQLVA